jgi:hypothetical protein
VLSGHHEGLSALVRPAVREVPLRRRAADSIEKGQRAVLTRFVSFMCDL